MEPTRIVIVGAGQAGAAALVSLRGAGFKGDLALIGSETHLPYERPPLSKGVLLSQVQLEDTYIRPGSWYMENAIALHLGVTVDAVDRIGKRVRMNDGTELSYDKLLVATGARARRLPDIQAANLHYLRDMLDATRLRDKLRPCQRLAVLGAGFIGMEVASTACRLGCRVTVFEQNSRALARSVPEEISAHLVALHQRHGVDFMFGARPELEIRNTSVTAICTPAGERHEVDVVVAGLGAMPNSELAEKAGLAVEDGILVDEYGRTSDTDIFAAGDVTRHPNPILGRRLRLESWQSALNQATIVAGNMIGFETPFTEIPWLWSDQYDVNLQVCGVPTSWDRVIRRPGLSEDAFTLFQIADSSVVGAVCVNSGRDMRFAKKLIEKQKLSAGLDVLADPAADLKVLTA